MINSYFQLKVWVCLRRAGVLCICGAFFAWVVAGEVFWNGHGQNVGWLLRHLFQSACVFPVNWLSVDVKVEDTLGDLAAVAECPKLEDLLIICEGIYNVRHLQLHKFPTAKSIFGVSYRFLWASSAEVPSHQRKAMSFSSYYWWNG